MVVLECEIFLLVFVVALVFVCLLYVSWLCLFVFGKLCSRVAAGVVCCVWAEVGYFFRWMIVLNIGLEVSEKSSFKWLLLTASTCVESLQCV
jgi:hypothetical protein